MWKDRFKFDNLQSFGWDEQNSPTRVRWKILIRNQWSCERVKTESSIRLIRGLARFIPGFSQIASMVEMNLSPRIHVAWRRCIRAGPWSPKKVTHLSTISLFMQNFKNYGLHESELVRTDRSFKELNSTEFHLTLFWWNAKEINFHNCHKVDVAVMMRKQFSWLNLTPSCVRGAKWLLYGNHARASAVELDGRTEQFWNADGILFCRLSLTHGDP